MSIFEIVIVVASAALLLGVPRLDPRRAALVALIVLAVGLGAHFALGEARWQMVPAYGLATIAMIVGLRRWRQGPFVRRRVWRVAGWIGAALLLLIAAVPPAALPVHRILVPTGPSNVGVQNFHLVDTQRRDPWGHGPRELMVRAWYPSRQPAACERMPYLSAAEARGLSEALSGGRQFLFAHLRRVRGNACVGAVPGGSGRLPVLLFGHGLGGHIAQNTAMMEELASHGYVVLSIAHPGDAAVVEFPGERTYPFKRKSSSSNTSAAKAEALSNTLARESDPVRYGDAVRAMVNSNPVGDAARLWSDDNRFVIDRINTGGLGSLDGRLDPARIGVFGHSLGGAAAIRTCAVDRRCIAAANMDGLQTGMPMRRDVDRPLLMLYFDHESAGRMFNDEFYRATPGAPGTAPLETVIIKDTGHLDGSDLTVAVATTLKRLLPRNGALGASDGEDNIRVTNALILAFFDEQLRGKRGAFAAELGRQPRVVRWQVPAYPPRSQ